jgi:hypothetical protein
MITIGHPLLLVGPDINLWATIIPDAFQRMFNPMNIKMPPHGETTSFIHDIIKLDNGKYIVTFNTVNTMLVSLYKNLYCDTARMVIQPDLYYEISIADITKQHYNEPTEFKTSGPYTNCITPIILYKNYIPRVYLTHEFFEDTVPIIN